MIVGGAVVLLWVYVPHDYKEVYEMIPGFILSFITTVVISLMTKPVDESIIDEFSEKQKQVKS